MKEIIKFFIVLLIILFLIKLCHISFTVGNCRIRVDGTYIKVDSVKYNRLR